MRHALLVVMLASCGKSESAPAPTAKAVPATKKAALKPVNADRLEKIRDTYGPVRPMGPWDPAYAHLVAEYGEPTHIGVNDFAVKVYSWASIRGDECFAFDVEQRDGTQFGDEPGRVVGNVGRVYPDRYVEATKQERVACLVAAGLAPVEDASTPGPHGKTATIGEIATNAVRARSKWTNKTLVVTGTVTKVSTQDRDTVLALADPDDPSKMLDATLYRRGEIEKVGTRVTYQCEVIASITPDDAGMPTGVKARLSYCKKPNG